MSLLYDSRTHVFPNPWWEMNHPTIKGISTTINNTSCSHSLSLKQLTKRHMKKGGKIKAGVTHVPRLLSLIHFIHKCGLPFIIYPCTSTCGPGLPLFIPYSVHHFITCHHHLKDVPWTYHQENVPQNAKYSRDKHI